MQNTTVPSAEDIARWKSWTESWFEEIGKVIGPTKSKGAQRYFGDFVFEYGARHDGLVDLWVMTNPSLPDVRRHTTEDWRVVTPAEAAANILAKLREIQAHPIYALTKRASEKRND